MLVACQHHQLSAVLIAWVIDESLAKLGHLLLSQWFSTLTVC